MQGIDVPVGSEFKVQAVQFDGDPKDICKFCAFYTPEEVIACISPLYCLAGHREDQQDVYFVRIL